jgi:tRNA (cmo5U34)-methyltransferase
MQQSEFAFTKEENEKNIREITEWYDEIGSKAPEEMAGFFTARLDGYEEHMKENFDFYKHLPKFLPNKTKTLLDLGCGTGLELDEIFKVYPDIRVTGIDMAHSMLEELAKKNSGRNIDIICADYFAYDFGRQRYDAVVSVQSLHHFKFGKKGEMYKKIYGALKPGSVYIEADYTASSDEHEKLCQDFYDRQREKFNVPDDMFVHIDMPLTLGHRKELFLAAGFSRIDTVFRAENTVVTVANK